MAYALAVSFIVGGIGLTALSVYLFKKINAQEKDSKKV